MRLSRFLYPQKAIWWSIAITSFLASSIEAETDGTCHPRLETEFRSVLIEATEQLDFRPLREAFGPGLEQLVGLECDPRVMRAILEDAGYRVFGGDPERGRRGTVLGLLQDRSLWGRLRNRRSAQAEVGISDGVITGFSIGPIK